MVCTRLDPRRIADLLYGTISARSRHDHFRKTSAVLVANRRIAEELKDVGKATVPGPGRGKKQITQAGKSFSGRAATGIPDTSLVSGMTRSHNKHNPQGSID
jgi:hypothetical protein